MFYIVDKPLKLGSNLVAKILKRVLNAPKIGFAGTLDPLATGLLIIGTHGSPRLFPLIEDLPKTYHATIRLDGTTSSYDLEQPIESVPIPEGIAGSLTQEKIQAVIDRYFIGEIMQIPPLFSATWIDGQRAYALARQGHETEIKAKKRHIISFSIMSYVWPRILCEITVSHGTYIRSIARDLGIKLGTGWYLEQLRRTSIGHIAVSEDLPWIQHNDIRYAQLRHEDLFPQIPVITLSGAEKRHLKLGSTPLPTSHRDGQYFVVYEDGMYGLLESKNQLLYPLKNMV